MDLPTSDMPELGNSDDETTQYPFLRNPVTYFFTPTSDVPDDIRRAAQRALTAMTRYNVMSTLPSSTFLDDISVGLIASRCTRCIHAVEALLRTHHLAMSSDDESAREQATAEVHPPAGPYSRCV